MADNIFDSISGTKAGLAAGVGGLGGFIYDRYIRGKKDLKSNLLHGLAFGGAGALAYSAYEVGSELLKRKGVIEREPAYAHNFTPEVKEARRQQAISNEERDNIALNQVAPAEAIANELYDKNTIPVTGSVLMGATSIPKILDPKKYDPAFKTMQDIANNRLAETPGVSGAKSVEAAQLAAKRATGPAKWGVTEVKTDTGTGTVRGRYADRIARANQAAVEAKATEAALKQLQKDAPALKEAEIQKIHDKIDAARKALTEKSDQLWQRAEEAGRRAGGEGLFETERSIKDKQLGARENYERAHEALKKAREELKDIQRSGKPLTRSQRKFLTETEARDFIDALRRRAQVRNLPAAAKAYDAATNLSRTAEAKKVAELEARVGDDIKKVVDKVNGDLAAATTKADQAAIEATRANKGIWNLMFRQPGVLSSRIRNVGKGAAKAGGTYAVLKLIGRLSRYFEDSRRKTWQEHL